MEIQEILVEYLTSNLFNAEIIGEFELNLVRLSSMPTSISSFRIFYIQIKLNSTYCWFRFIKIREDSSIITDWNFGLSKKVFCEWNSKKVHKLFSLNFCPLKLSFLYSTSQSSSNFREKNQFSFPIFYFRSWTKSPSGSNDRIFPNNGKQSFFWGKGKQLSQLEIQYLKFFKVNFVIVKWFSNNADFDFFPKLHLAGWNLNYNI